MTLVITIAVFIGALCIIEGSFLFLRNRFDPEKRRVREKLRRLTDESTEAETTSLTRRRPLSSLPWLNRLLSAIPLMQRLDILLVQANLKQPLGVFVLLTLVLAGVAFLMGVLVFRSWIPSLILAILLGATPLIYILIQKKRRVDKFERQLPDALDLIARSLRAGHAFSTGLGMVGQEFDDPIGTEFRKTQTQIGLGVGVDQALKALLERMDCPDLRFFAVSVIIQRETGGNLAEILESIGSLIRSRFKLRGRIRTLSAEGKLSAIILLGIPFFIAISLSIINPSYLAVLREDPAGRILVICALLMMMIGIISIKKMIGIKV